MLSGCQTTTTSDDLKVFDIYMKIASTVSCISISGTCPISVYLLSLLSTLNEFQWEDPLVQESWLLLLPICVIHSRSVSCCSQTCGIDISIFQSKILQAAISVLNTVHHFVSSSEVFIPPFIAASKAFTSGCALVTGIKEGWQGAGNVTSALLKCSEILTFSAPLWRGGKEYYEVWRKTVAAI